MKNFNLDPRTWLILAHLLWSSLIFFVGFRYLLVRFFGEPIIFSFISIGMQHRRQSCMIVTVPALFTLCCICIDTLIHCVSNTTSSLLLYLSKCLLMSLVTTQLLLVERIFKNFNLYSNSWWIWFICNSYKAKRNICCH